MTELNIKTGDIIEYSCAAGRLRATVNKVKFGPTTRPGYSIPWLYITIQADAKNGRRFAGNVSLPADSGSLSAYKVEVINA